MLGGLPEIGLSSRQDKPISQYLFAHVEVICLHTPTVWAVAVKVLPRFNSDRAKDLLNFLAGKPPYFNNFSRLCCTKKNERN
jgi:hypothetical protein